MPITKLDAFPLCCGVYVINNFPHYVTTAFKETLEKIKSEISGYYEARSTGLYLIALNGTQKPLYDSLLKDLDFRVMVDDFVNPIHNSRVTLYGRAVIGENQAPDILPMKTAFSVFQKFHNHNLRI